MVPLIAVSKLSASVLLGDGLKVVAINAGLILTVAVLITKALVWRLNCFFRLTSTFS